MTTDPADHIPSDEHLERLGDHLAELEGDERADDLRRHLAAYRAGDRSGEDLLDRLREAARRFESSHPDLTAVIARVIDSLTAAGI